MSAWVAAETWDTTGLDANFLCVSNSGGDIADAGT